MVGMSRQIQGREAEDTGQHAAIGSRKPALLLSRQHAVCQEDQGQAQGILWNAQIDEQDARKAFYSRILASYEVDIRRRSQRPRRLLKANEGPLTAANCFNRITDNSCSAMELSLNSGDVQVSWEALMGAHTTIRP
jgi:hypothetical protein